MTAKRNRSIFLMAASVPLAGICGCPLVQTPPEAVLEGTWEFIPSDTVDSRITNWFLTFDSNGRLTQVAFTLSDGDTIPWYYPPGVTEVDEDQVHVSVALHGNAVTFDGTLDSATAPTIATGFVSARFTFGDIEISEPEEAATLVKQ